MTIWGMRIACRIPKATNIQAEYVMLIAFPRQQWLRERPSMLRLYVQYMACVVYNDHGLRSVCSRKYVFNDSGIVMSSSVLMSVNVT
jgi:hypothetical protein